MKLPQVWQQELLAKLTPSSLDYLNTTSCCSLARRTAANLVSQLISLGLCVATLPLSQRQVFLQSHQLCLQVFHLKHTSHCNPKSKTSPESIKHSKVATLRCLTVCELDCIQIFSRPILTDGRSVLSWDTKVVELVHVSVTQDKMTPHTHTYKNSCQWKWLSS